MEELKFDALSGEYGKVFLKIESAPKDYVYSGIKCPDWLTIRRKSDWTGLELFPQENVNDDYSVSQPREGDVELELKTVEDSEYDGIASCTTIAHVYQDGFEFAGLSATSNVIVDIYQDENNKIWCQYEIENYNIFEGSGVTLTYDNRNVELFGEIGLYIIELTGCTDVNSVELSKEAERYEYGRCYIKVYTSNTTITTHEFIPSINFYISSDVKQLKEEETGTFKVNTNDNVEWELFLYAYNFTEKNWSVVPFDGKSKITYTGTGETVIECKTKLGYSEDSSRYIISGYTTNTEEPLTASYDFLVYKEQPGVPNISLSGYYGTNEINTHNDYKIGPQEEKLKLAVISNDKNNPVVIKAQYNGDEQFINPSTGLTEVFYPQDKIEIPNIKIKENTGTSIINFNVTLSGVGFDGVLTKLSKDRTFKFSQDPYVVGVYGEKVVYNETYERLELHLPPDADTYPISLNFSGNCDYVVYEGLYTVLEKIHEGNKGTEYSLIKDIDVTENASSSLKTITSYPIYGKFYDEDKTKKYGYYSGICWIQQDIYQSIITSPEIGHTIDSSTNYIDVTISANTAGKIISTIEGTEHNRISFEKGVSIVRLNIPINTGNRRSIILKTINDDNKGKGTENYQIYQEGRIGGDINIQ